MSDPRKYSSNIADVSAYATYMENQLAERDKLVEDQQAEIARLQQECDRLKKELEASDWVGEQACKAIGSAIKKTARECIEAIEKQHGGLGLAFTLRQRYGLEG